jgi:hypothetical protein
LNNLIDSALYIATVITALLGAGFALHRFFSPMTKTVKDLSEKLDKFFRDWDGTPEEPGRDAIPGVMERLNRLDGELSRNGGKSVKDTVNRIEKRLEEGNKTFDSLDSRITKLEGKID